MAAPTSTASLDLAHSPAGTAALAVFPGAYLLVEFEETPPLRTSYPVRGGRLLGVGPASGLARMVALDYIASILVHMKPNAATSGTH